MLFAEFGTTGGVGLIDPELVGFLEGGVVLIGVGDGIGSRREEMPGSGTFEGNGGDKLARLGSVSGGADELLHGNEVLATGASEGGEGFFIAGGNEAEVGISGIEEVILVGGVTEGSLGRRGEAGLEDSFSINDKASGIASAKEDSMGAGREGDAGGGAKKIGGFTVVSHAGGDVVKGNRGEGEM